VTAIRASWPYIVCTDCLEGNHEHCDDWAFDEVADEATACDCYTYDHDPPWEPTS
jgi:hypothetical protein